MVDVGWVVAAFLFGVGAALWRVSNAIETCPGCGNWRDKPKTPEAWRLAYERLCDVFFPDSVGRPRLLTWNDIQREAQRLRNARDRAQDDEPDLPKSADRR